MALSLFGLRDYEVSVSMRVHVHVHVHVCMCAVCCNLFQHKCKTINQ